MATMFRKGDGYSFSFSLIPNGVLCLLHRRETLLVEPLNSLVWLDELGNESQTSERMNQQVCRMQRFWRSLSIINTNEIDYPLVTELIKKRLASPTT